MHKGQPTKDLPPVGMEEQAEAVLPIVHEDLLRDLRVGAEHHELPKDGVPRKPIWIHQTLALPKVIRALDHLDYGPDVRDGEGRALDRAAPDEEPGMSAETAALLELLVESIAHKQACSHGRARAPPRQGRGAQDILQTL